MAIQRRSLLAGAVGLASLGLGPPVQAGPGGMYGLIGKMTTTSGQRDAMTAILLEGTAAMPGCLSYVVAHDPEESDAIWITEVWADEAAHSASLQLPAVRAAIARGRPLIAGFGDPQVTRPVGGVGISPRA